MATRGNANKTRPTSHKKTASSNNGKCSNSSKANSTPEITTELENAGSQDDVWEVFELELRWCLQQIENQLRSNKLNPRQMEQSEKVLKALTNPKTPFIKKRQIMRTTFGDYRKLMKEEELKHNKGMKQICMLKVDESKQKGTFIRKSGLSSATQSSDGRNSEKSTFRDDSNSQFHKSESFSSFRFNFITREGDSAEC